MFELDLKAYILLCIGAGGVLVVIMVMALCEVSGRWSRIEEAMDARIEEAMKDHDRLMEQKWSRYK